MPWGYEIVREEPDWIILLPGCKELVRWKMWIRQAGGSGREATLTLVDWWWIRFAYDYQCAYCGRKEITGVLDLQQDHVVPVSKGGGYTAANIVPACITCNASKNAKVWEPRVPGVKSIPTGGQLLDPCGMVLLTEDWIRSWIARLPV